MVFNLYEKKRRSDFMSVHTPQFPEDFSPPSINRLIQTIERVIVGKRDRIIRMVGAMLAGGHVLLEDVPGVGKTMLVRALAASIGCSYKRIQFTPDLLPSDVVGASVYNNETRQFEFRPGPIMAQIVLADELNRTSPRTQSALLEAMEEGRVTVDGAVHSLPQPFTLIATQNPLEYEGTFRLPEAQLDRFMIKLRLGYPSAAQEEDMLGRLTGEHPIERLEPAVTVEEWIRMQRQCSAVHVDDSLKSYIVSIVHATRNSRDIELGASPRASYALMRAAQAEAFMRGRKFLIPDDVLAMAVPVLAHRIVPAAGSRLDGPGYEAIIREIAVRCAVPGIRGGGRR